MHLQHISSNIYFKHRFIYLASLNNTTRRCKMNKLTSILAGVLLTAVTILPLSGCYKSTSKEINCPQKEVLVIPGHHPREHHRRPMHYDQRGQDRDNQIGRGMPDYDGRRDFSRERPDFNFSPENSKMDEPKYGPRIERPEFGPGRDRGEFRAERPNYNGRNESESQRQGDLRQRGPRSYEGRSANGPEHKESPAK
jgi:hypothetical protein